MDPVAFPLLVDPCPPALSACVRGGQTGALAGASVYTMSNSGKQVVRKLAGVQPPPREHAAGGEAAHLGASLASAGHRYTRGAIQLLGVGAASAGGPGAAAAPTAGWRQLGLEAAALSGAFAIGIVAVVVAVRRLRRRQYEAIGAPRGGHSGTVRGHLVMNV